MKPTSRSFNKFWLLWLFWSLLKPLLRLPSVNAFSSPKNRTVPGRGSSQCSRYFSSFSSLFGVSFKAHFSGETENRYCHTLRCIFYCILWLLRIYIPRDRCLDSVLIDKFNLHFTARVALDGHLTRMEFRGRRDNWAWFLEKLNQQYFSMPRWVRAELTIVNLRTYELQSLYRDLDQDLA